SETPPELLTDDFSDGNHNGWSVVDDGMFSGPSNWSASTGALRQTSGVYSWPTSSSSIPRPGTHAFFAEGTSWTDYTFEADLRSSDADSIGVMFRYQDNNNYYRFSMDRTLSQRRLVKKVNGSYTLLHQDTIRYSLNTTYRVSVTVVGNSISVSLNGQPFYSGTDSSVSAGSVGFYCWRNSGATFDNVTVVPAMSSARSVVPDVAAGTILLADDIAGWWSTKELLLDVPTLKLDGELSEMESASTSVSKVLVALASSAGESSESELLATTSASVASLLHSPPPWSGGGLGWGQLSLTEGTTEQQGSLR